MASRARLDSNALLREWGTRVTGDVLSVGSSRDGDKEGARYRDYFAHAKSYTTSDCEPSYGCDLVLDLRHADAPDASYDAVFCSGVLEHIDDVHAAVREVWRLLRPGGWFVVGVPFMQGVHRAPMDFWRFTEFGLRWLLRDFVVADVRALGDARTPECYWALAQKVAR